MSQMKGRKGGKVALIIWEIALIASLIGLAVAKTVELIPSKYWIYGSVFTLLFLLVTFLLVKAVKSRGVHTFASVLNILLILCMVGIMIFLPYLKSKVINIFTHASTTTEVVNVYAMTGEYKQGHTNIFKDASSPDQLQDYAGATFITQKMVDAENTDFALDQIRQTLGQSPKTMDAENVLTAVKDLYENKGQALVLSENYSTVVSDVDAYKNFAKDTKIIATFNRTVENTSTSDEQSALRGDCFSIFIAGSDTRSGVLSTKSRFDVDMVATVNKKTHQVLISSLPRDSYIPNPAMGGAKDKLTHMGIYGVDNSIKAINQWLGSDIKNYSVVNFVTFSKIIDALGGVTVDNPYAFTATNAGGYSFPKGKVTLNGQEALGYVRERHSLPNGDFDRNMHQTIILKAILSKLVSPEMITRLPAVMDSLKGAFLTDADMNSLYQLASTGSGWEFITARVTGSTGSAVTASMPGQKLSVVFPKESERAAVADKIQKMMKNERITS